MDQDKQIGCQNNFAFPESAWILYFDNYRKMWGKHFPFNHKSSYIAQPQNFVILAQSLPFFVFDDFK